MRKAGVRFCSTRSGRNHCFLADQSESGADPDHVEDGAQEHHFDGRKLQGQALRVLATEHEA